MMTASSHFEDVSKKNHNTDSRTGDAAQGSNEVTKALESDRQNTCKSGNRANKAKLREQNNSQQIFKAKQSQNCHVVQTLTGATR